MKKHKREDIDKLVLELSLREKMSLKTELYEYQRAKKREGLSMIELKQLEKEEQAYDEELHKAQEDLKSTVQELTQEQQKEVYKKLVENAHKELVDIIYDLDKTKQKDVIRELKLRTMTEEDYTNERVKKSLLISIPIVLVTVIAVTKLVKIKRGK